MKWIGVAALALVAVVVIVVAVFWFTIPATPTLGDFEPSAPDSTVTKPALRTELLQMRALDQAVRESAFGSDGPDMTSVKGLWRFAQQGIRMRRVDRPNTERLKEIVAEHGWPTRAEVGPDGRSAIFLLVQHADHDPSFQRAALDPMREAYEAGDATGSDLAMLTDRVRVAEGRPQLYGSQIYMESGKPPELRPIEDEANVDARRAELGLPPLSEYLVKVCEETGMCVER